MRHLLAIALLTAGVMFATSCSDDDSPTRPAPPRVGYELRPAYYYFDGQETQELIPMPDQFVIRFHSYVAQGRRTELAKKYNVTLDETFTQPRIAVTWAYADDVFAAARELSKELDVEYVGPIFSLGCEKMLPQNELIIRGDFSDPTVMAALEDVDAALDFTRPDDPTRALARLPWGDPGILFDLSAALEDNPAIEYVDVNFTHLLCRP